MRHADTAPMIPEGATLAVMQQRSFSDQTAQRLLLNRKDLQIAYYETVPEAYQIGMNNGEYVVLPFENSSASPSVVWSHVDLLDEDESAELVGVVYQNIRICIAALEGASMDNVTTVRSHPKALEQSSMFISNWEKIEDSSTTAALEAVAQKGDPTVVALGTKEAIEHIPGLCVLYDGNNVTNLPTDQNITQFFVVKRNGGKPSPDAQKQYHACVMRVDEQGPGSLVRVLSILKAGGANLTSIHSRGEDLRADSSECFTEFFVEMERTSNSHQFATMIRRMEQLGYLSDFRWLGSWDHQVEPAMHTHTVDAPSLQPMNANTDHRYHRFAVEPNDYAGALHDILEVVSDSRVNLAWLQTRNLGHKQYMFDVLSDISTARSAGDVHDMYDTLYHSGLLRRAAIESSSDNLSDLLPGHIKS